LAYTPNCFQDIDSIIATIKKQLNREGRVCAEKNTIKSMMEQRRWPKGGLQQLRDHIDAGWPYYDSLVALRQAGGTLSSSQLAFGFRYTIASLYGYEENARAMAIEEMTMSGKRRDYSGDSQ